MSRVTLPKQRAIETRERIIDAAGRVFARRGFGEATVQDIADEADVSMGALYHHFSGKEELFRAIMAHHIRRDVLEYTPQPAKTAREAIEHFVGFQIDHLRALPEFPGLSMELWAQAMREEWAREACAGSFKVFRDLVRRLLTIAKDAGVARADIDVDACITLFEAIFVGLEVQFAITPERVDFDALAVTWADMVERFLTPAGVGDVDALGRSVSQMFRELRESEDLAR